MRRRSSATSPPRWTATAVAFAVTSSSFAYGAGQAGLNTSRLECRLEATVDFTVAHTVRFDDGYLADRVGWHEINAIGEGTQLVDSPVPATSVTDGLTQLPGRSAQPRRSTCARPRCEVQPGSGSSTVSADAPDRAGVAQHRDVLERRRPRAAHVRRSRRPKGLTPRRRAARDGAGARARRLARRAARPRQDGDGRVHRRAAGVGAATPWSSGRRSPGRTRAACCVLGTALTLSTSLAGESVLGWLGVTSGLLIAVLGVGLLRSAVAPPGHRSVRPRAHPR